jgi:hypothetical protein
LKKSKKKIAFMGEKKGEHKKGNKLRVIIKE